MELLRSQFQIEYLTTAVNMLLDQGKVKAPEMDAGKWYKAKLDNKQLLTDTCIFSRIDHMNKKIITALIALTLIVPATTHAVDAPKTATLAIIDTAIDTSLPLFSGKIVHEVCILEWNSCPNGTSFMEL